MSTAAVIRPVFKWRSPAKQAAWLLPLLTLVISTGDRPVPAIASSMALGLVLAGVVLGLGWFSLKQAGFGLVEGALVHRRSPRRKTIITARGRPVTIVRIERKDDPGHWWQVWVGDGGAAAFDERLWDPVALARLAEELHADVETEPEPLSPRELVRRFPGTMPWYVKHFALGVALFVVACLALSILVDALVAGEL